MIGLLGLVLSLGPVAVAGAQTVVVDAEKRTYTEAELDHITPSWPNPYLSFLPPDATPDWHYWRAKMRLEGRRRAARLAGFPKAVPIVDEGEPSDARGWNDDQASAELITDFGTGLGAMPEVDVAGTLYVPTPTEMGPFEEDDGSIPLANDAGLTPGQRVRISGYIGDGPYGSNAASNGDFDVFKVTGVRAGQTVTVDIDTPEEDSVRLDTKVALYDSTGFIVDINDDGIVGSPDSFLEVQLEADGDYYVFVRGINSFWPIDPFDSGSGPKAGSEGPYTVTLGLDAGDVDFYSLDLKAGDVLGINLDDQARQITLFDPSGVELMGSGLDGSVLFPRDSPLPGGGNASAAYVMGTAGRYAVAVWRGEGPYTLALRVFRPILEASPDCCPRSSLPAAGRTLGAPLIKSRFQSNRNLIGVIQLDEKGRRMPLNLLPNLR